MPTTAKQSENTIVVAGINGYNVTVDVNADGSSTLRVRHAVTGKINATVYLGTGETADLGTQTSRQAEAAADDRAARRFAAASAARRSA